MGTGWTPWAIAAGGALLGGAWWLREPRLPYVVAGLVATAVATLWAVRATRLAPRAPRWQWLCVALLGAFWIAAAAAQRELWSIDSRWTDYAAAEQRDAEARGARELTALSESLQRVAAAALDVPAEPEAAFAAARGALGSSGVAERGVVVYESGHPLAWAGEIRVSPDSLGGAAGAWGVARSEFYDAAYAVARRGSRRAVAIATLDAAPPADRFARTLVQDVSRRGATIVLEPTAAAPGVRARALPLVAAEVRLHAVQRAKERGAVLLGVALLAFLSAAWRGRRLPRRLAALGVALASVGASRLSDLSGALTPFDPSYYYAPIGGTLSANAGALILSAALALVGLLAVLRASARLRSRRIATAVVLAVAGLGPFLLRDLASGITAPPAGITTALWLWWQLALFLAAVAVLLAGASAGRALLGPRRGIHPAVAPLLAAIAALLGPVLLQAPSRWPGWYPALWIAAVGALALTRRTRGFVLLAAAVAGAGAATLTWGATVRKREALAERDVAALREVDPYMRTLAERLADELAAAPPEAGRAGLLQAYVASPLALAGFPAALTVWDERGEIAHASFAAYADSERPDSLGSLVRDAARTGLPVSADVLGPAGAELAIAVPHGDGAVTTLVAAPRTRLTPDDPFAALYGFAIAPGAEPPYDIALTDASSPLPGPAPADGPWRREGEEVHRDFYLRTSHGLARAHVEVGLRSLDALGQRGTLVILLDMAIVGILWSLAALSDGPLARWLGAWRKQWMYSYRARLSIALLTFFLVPAIAFVAWSYRRVQSDDRQARELVLREGLRGVEATAGAAGRPAVTSLAEASVVTGTPVLFYGDGELRGASDSLYTQLAPVGRFLAPSVYLTVAIADEVSASRTESLGEARTLFGYRAVGDGAGGRAVLAAPARTNEIALDRRRRDLGVLVLFATVIGVVAAFWASGFAARELARPIGRLRRAALALAAGEREPVVDARVPAEFEPVFSAFGRMAHDLSASQQALEEAQRRTAAVLRNVASGVVAVDADGAVLLANPRAAALLERELPAGLALDAWAADEAARRVRDFVAGGRRDEEEFDEEHGDRQLHGRLTRLAAGGAVLTLDDVTEVARAQRVLAWGEMARQVAHEIKNPLTPIRLGVQHLKRARADGRADFDRILDQNVERILGEIDRLDEIARAFSRYGTAPAERPAGGPVDVAAVVRDVVALEQMGEGTVQWSLAGADGPAIALAGEEELREVLLNLLENARLAGAAHVRVSLAAEGARVVLRVADDGQGIPDDVMPRIFEPHFSTRTSGSGLGLAISRRMIDGWGGEIAVRSERGAGTEVVVRLARA